MSSLFDPSLSLSQFKLPPQDIDLLSFCLSNKPAKLQDWVDSLKLTQINQTTVSLYHAVPEIIHLKVDSSTRFTMLEALWPVVQQSLQVFSKEFLQQPLLLPPQAQKAAIISQALQKHLLDGYTLCAKDLAHQKKLKSHKKELLLNCLYRAMCALGRLMLRSYQLYTPVPPKMWLRAHSLLQTAEFYELQNETIKTQDGKHKTLIEVYTQLLAMGCLRPNQLSQNDINTAYTALESWSKHITLFPAATEDHNNLFVVSLTRDTGPQAKIRFTEDENDRIFELDLQSLTSQLKNLSSNSDNNWETKGKGITIPSEMPSTLVDHILDSWSHCSERDQQRKSITVHAEACIGIIDCHYHISGRINFDQFLNPNSMEPAAESFLSSGFDDMISSLSKADKEVPAKDQKTNIFEVSIQNVSSGGYCINWKGALPSRIEAGELIGIREEGRRAWSIGIIRWIKQSKNTSQLGVQILCSQPIPYGASVTLDNGLESEYMRVIHIPAPTMGDQPPSLLTTTVPFQVNRRVELKQDDNSTFIRLGKSVFSTSKLKLFDFETLSQDDDNSANSF